MSPIDYIKQNKSQREKYPKIKELCIFKIIILTVFKILVNYFNYPKPGPSMYLSVYISIFQSMYLYVYLSIFQSMYLSVYVSIFQSIYRSIFLSIHLSIY